MKKSIILVIFTFFMMLSHLSIEPLSANAGENDCILKASVDVIVEVWNLDNQGNKGHRIWKGQRQSIKSRYGKIRYSYRLYNQSRTSSRNFQNCERGKIIQLP